MRMFYIAFEFTHDKQQPNAVIGKQSTRVGPVKRWVDEGSPHMVDGKLRERVALVLPSGFRFRKDEVHNYLRSYNTYTDAKFSVAMVHALGKYLPYDAKNQTRLNGVVKAGVTNPAHNADQVDGNVPGDESLTISPVSRVTHEPQVVEGSPATR